MTVRVRFAPNPSGELHVGGARTALFNWLFARHHGGVFVLRVEDTDPATARPEFIEPIFEGLRWLGLDWDEGPEVGGPHGPYRQSERREQHDATVARLVEAGAVYRCYCTPEEVKARGTSRGYDRHCRTLDEKQVAAFEAEDRSYALRFRVPDGPVVLQDLVREEVRVEGGEIQDFVVARSDGRPTFVLANVSDDLAMGITHAIRGEDILSSAIQNLLLYRALGEDAPRYAHLPVILNEKRQKLSKRQMATGVHAFRAAGYLEEAMVNYLALLGWSPGTGEELLTREQLVASFDLDRVLHHGAVFDRQKLDWMNQEYLKRLSPADLEARVLELHPEVPKEVLRRTIDLELVQSRVKTLSEVPDAIRYLHERPTPDEKAAGKWLGTEEADRTLGIVADRLEALEDWVPERIKEIVQGTIAELDLHKRKGMKPVFVAVAGSEVALPLFESMAIIGHDETVTRLRAAVAG